MAGPNAEGFVPGGRRFTVITPFSLPGRPTTVLFPVLEMGESTSDLSHLVKKRHRSPSSSTEPRRYVEFVSCFILLLILYSGMRSVRPRKTLDPQSQISRASSQENVSL